MDMVKLGKKGQVSIPRAVLKRIGIDGEVPLLVETTEDGAILLRPAGVYPVEMYSDARIDEFLQEDRLEAGEAEKLKAKLRKKKAA